MNGLMSENESETGNIYWSPPIYAVQWADTNFGEKLTSTAWIRQILTLNITHSGGGGGGLQPLLTYFRYLIMVGNVFHHNNHSATTIEIRAQYKKCINYYFVTNIFAHVKKMYIAFYLF